jgi:hypothetical protein
MVQADRCRNADVEAVGSGCHRDSCNVVATFQCIGTETIEFTSYEKSYAAWALDFVKRLCFRIE